LLQALTALQSQGTTTASQSEGEQQQGDGGEATATALDTGPPSETQQLTTVEKSRMTYAIGALCHLPDWYQPDESTGRIAELDESFWQTLTVAGGPSDSRLLDLFRLNFSDRAAFPSVLHVASHSGLIEKKVALVPMCQPKLMTVRGHPCV